MRDNTVRVVIDTNIWISFLIGKTLSGLSEAIISGQVIVLFSNDLFSELIEVLNRPKFKKYFSASAIEELIALLYEKIELIEIINHFNDCRDLKDNFLLDLAVSGHAHYLVTGDADLLILNPFHGVEIISYQAFQNVI
ncbi:putative toxin-antitoxin system toxin component, PIN family [Pseudanabaena sp. SR411]|uniref:putative toxin-antitoxin system toxin component, PIN family n=1 Tax=Pseudanabaena sp. SR411 TaxID=1980935 RepID=UPI000B9945D8|nr:putative toxin-antitoxin system toxin component, PIN family [Pseudanabaena sp. SR411]OYQ64371.1 putative toxin-antitoxin system toxin component, PIN family [Pseudanabaena sp. SR411]